MTSRARRMGRIALRLLVLALEAGLLLAALLAWRLSRGPIGLDVLTPYVEAGLGRSDGSLVVHVGTTQLVWNGERRHLNLRVHDVEILGRSGDALASVPALAIRLSGRALFHGVIAPREIAMLGPRVRLVRQPDGRIDLGLGEEVEPAAGNPLLSALSDGLFGARTVGGSPVRLDSVEVSEGELTLVDRPSGRTWRVPDIDLRVWPEGAGLAARSSGALEVDAAHVPVTLDAVYRRAPDGVDAEIHFRGLDPSAFAAASGAPETPPSATAALAAGVRLPLDGTLRLTLDSALAPVHARLELAGGSGVLAASGLPGGSVEVKAIGAALELDPGANALRLDDLALDLGGPAVHVRGRLAGLHGTGTVEAEITLARLPTGALPRYWPEAVAAAARQWVTANVSGGEVRTLEARVAGTLTDGEPGSFALDTLAGALTFDGLAVRYLDPMSPLTGVAGTGTFTRQALNLHVARGSVAGLELVRAIVDVPLAADRPRIAVDTSVGGPLAKALALLDQKPLGWTRALGITPAEVGGTVAGRLVLGVPLGDPVTAATLGPRASARMQDAAVSRLPNGWSLAGGKLQLELDGQRLRLTGDARLQGVPVTVVWDEDLGARRPVRRRVELVGRIDRAGRAALGFDQMAWLDGPVDAKVGYTVPGAGAAKLGLDLDLAAATIEMPTLDLAKRAGEPGRALVDLTLAGDAVTAVDRLELRAGESTVSGQAVRSSAGGGWRTIDAQASIAPRTPTDHPGHFTLAVSPQRRGNHFTLSSDDAGALFRALGPYSDAEGGRLTFTGTVDLGAPGLPFDGRVDVRDFTLTRQPTLARVATLASLSGITSALSGGGIAFEKMEAGLSHRDGLITLRDGRAKGSSIGLTFRGTIERTAGTVALEGTLVPSYYGLNQVPGRLPIIGEIMTGTRKEGVLVVDFQVSGSTADPQVSVRPSSLAPGVVRDLLRLLPR